FVYLDTLGVFNRENCKSNVSLTCQGKILLKVKAVKAGIVAIRGHKTGLYLAMDKYGKLYSTCCFIEKIEENHYNTYRSQKYQENGDWYVGIKKNGRMKNGSKTHKGQNAIYFLPIPVDGSIQ
uniref:Fibroblast growth factor n=1 Tax=Sinocyclocheilus grahami TaxID=75366 RepID=A0A672RFL7_SINGR